MKASSSEPRPIGEVQIHRRQAANNMKKQTADSLKQAEMHHAARWSAAQTSEGQEIEKPHVEGLRARTFYLRPETRQPTNPSRYWQNQAR
jgi:hypothetical protein